MKSCTTFTATIYVGMAEHDTSEIRSIEMAKKWLHEYVNSVGLCVTIVPTDYIYTGKGGDVKTSAGEPGLVVGLINYPRFPVEPMVIKNHALTIAHELLKLYKQFKVTVVFPDESIMVEAGDV